MTAGLQELFKAIFVTAIFACLCGLLRVALLERLDFRLKLAVGSFLALMLLPTTYLYLHLAFAPAAAMLLPLQAMAIWMYGPMLLAILHIVSRKRVRAWWVAGYAAPLVCAAAVRLSWQARGFPTPGWWELLSFVQATGFAVAAIVWTIRTRAQLRIVMTGFSRSTFGALLYLCGGLLALLLADFFVHWRLYAGPPLSVLTFYSLVTPCALYGLIISMTLIWRNPDDASAGEELPMSAPAPQVPEPEPEHLPAPARNLELSPAAAHELELLLNTLMQDQRLYTRNDLTLVELAAALRISTHLASELLNAHLHTNFYEFLNRHRAEEAARLLRAGEGKLTIADIAYQAGFNNPNTFYREFKRAHGVTPARFRKSDPAGSPRVEPSIDRPAPH